MQAVKIAVSIEKNLYEQADRIAKQMKISRCELLVLALQDFVEHQKNKEMLDQITAAYEDDPDPAEEALHLKRGAQHRRIVEEVHIVD